MKSLFEQMGGTYRQEGDYLLPNLDLPDTPQQIGKYGLLFAAFVMVVSCAVLHCRPGTVELYPLIYTLVLLSCLLISADVFLRRRCAAFLLLPLGGLLFGSLLYFIVSGRWDHWFEAVFLAVLSLPALGVSQLFFAGIALLCGGKRKIVPGLLCLVLALLLILSAVFILWGDPVRAVEAKRALDRWMDGHPVAARYAVGKFRYDFLEGHFYYEVRDEETGEKHFLKYWRGKSGKSPAVYCSWEGKAYK